MKHVLLSTPQPALSPILGTASNQVKKNIFEGPHKDLFQTEMWRWVFDFHCDSFIVCGTEVFTPIENKDQFLNWKFLGTEVLQCVLF
jgi:hypothetical protein